MQTTQKGWGSPAVMRVPHVAGQACDRLSKVVTGLGLERANNNGKGQVGGGQPSN